MAFYEVEFPRQIGFTSTGGAGFSTQVNEGFSGFEQRNRNWAKSRGVWQIVLSRRPFSDFQDVYSFFLNVGGKADAFRLYWPLDYSATGQAIGTGTGAKLTFQIVKTYAAGGRTYTRTINKPIMSTVKDFRGNALTDTVKIYDAGTLKTLHADYEVDATTGVVTFGAAPTTGHAITADFEFHYPVRFDVDDQANLQIEESDVAGGNALVTWSQCALVEVRLS